VTLQAEFASIGYMIGRVEIKYLLSCRKLGKLFFLGLIPKNFTISFVVNDFEQATDAKLFGIILTDDFSFEKYLNAVFAMHLQRTVLSDEHLARWRKAYLLLSE
jgi:hypothetical protein